MRTSILLAAFLAFAPHAHSGDWGKAPLPKEAIEECLDLGGVLDVGYQSHYFHKGLLVGGDTVQGQLSYSYDRLALPLTFGVRYANIVAPNTFANVFEDELAVSARVGLPTVAGIESALSYTHFFYPESPNTPLWPSSHGEIGLHLAKDLEWFVLRFNLFHNFGLPNAWNGTIPTLNNGESGAWYWDFGADRRFDLCDRAALVIGAGVAFADNYWGTAPDGQTGGRSSGWNHYYVNASLPIELNCRTILTPYIGFVGTPDTWLMDGAPDWANRATQSDQLFGGLNLSVSF
jgi:hypothetical protein